MSRNDYSRVINNVLCDNIVIVRVLAERSVHVLFNGHGKGSRKHVNVEILEVGIFR